MATTWKIDPAHSEIQFKVKHLMLTTVTGYFRQFEGGVITEGEDFNTTTSLWFKAKADSLDTTSEQRDAHLKSPEFFDVKNFPEVSFSGTRFETLGENATMEGNLTIKGISKPISLEVEFAGQVVDPYGQYKAGFTFSGKLSRKEYGMLWNAVTETGGIVASDEVRLLGEVQVIRQPASA